MELKSYQKNVIGDLSRFLALLVETGTPAKAYSALWEEKNVIVGPDGMPAYRYNLKNWVPDVCLKVPTGGGKTFIAACAIKTIYDAMPTKAAKAVVWLVPSDAILTQTYAALSNPGHPYRQRLDVDFSGRVEVYSKVQLLNGQNFNPTAVVEQLSVFVVSYDSFRTSRKEGRKAYQENGNLAIFPKMMQDKSMLLPDTDETALIQVIRSLNPVVVVDESHHATSALSVEMLENFNPSFVLDLTATPKKSSNIISFVDAAELKKANMVKLPVIVYNRKSQDDVFADAINIRCKLETQAIRERQTSGRYIRPIVLFQAQPKNSADSTTYEKIKDTLIEAGIPSDQIAIKTADKDELKNQDLSSPICPIRYIITVNALKEGWDCPFAYVLATVANRTSTVDVEQILGRVLRLPDAQKNASDVLNISYVLTSSADFGKTLDQVIRGLNSAGFSKRDCRAKDAEPEAPISAEVQLQFPVEPDKQEEPEEPELPVVDLGSLRQRVVQSIQPQDPDAEVDLASDELLSAALAQNDAYLEQAAAKEGSAVEQAPVEVRDKMNVFKMNEAFAEEASSLRFPQFMLVVSPSFFSKSGTVRLELEHLSEGFTLKDKDAQIDFNTIEAEMARVDTDEQKDGQPSAWQINGADSIYYKAWFNGRPSEVKMGHFKNQIKSKINKLNCVNAKELDAYIDRVVETLSEDQLSDMEQSVYPYVTKVEDKVKSLLAVHRAELFDLWLAQGKIICEQNYTLKSTISPTSYTSIFPKSLYTGEEDMNDYERKAVWALASLENIKWWHRNISRLGFQINGPIHAYPDIIAMTNSGRILMIETKGDHLDNAESKAKAKCGAQWASLAGPQYRYFMVFEHKTPDYPGAYSYDRFMEIVKGL